MAERRMFAKTIIDSDAFLDMPLSSQALYFHLSMRADDEGFVNNPKKIQRMIGASDDDMKVLFAKKFIIVFDSGVIVIKHWKIHNNIRSDRLKQTAYQEERKQLSVKTNGAYTLTDKCPSNVRQVSVTCPSNVSIGKDSIGKDSIDKDKECKHAHGEFQNVFLTDKEYQKLLADFPEAEEAIEHLSAYIAEKGYKSKSHYLAIRRWVITAVRERKEKEKRTAPKKPHQQMMTSDIDVSDLEKKLRAN